MECMYMKRLGTACLLGGCLATSAMAGGVVTPEIVKVEKESEPKWSLRMLTGVGTKNSLGQISKGQVNLLGDTTVYSLELGRMLWTDAWGLPIDISANIGTLFHESDRGASDIMQYNIYVKFEWTSFPWNNYLRTRVGVGEGLSWVENITYSESQRRDGAGSVRFLNYLDFSFSFNASDLGRLLQLDHVFSNDLQSLDETWLVANVSHRSGIYGAFGNARGDDGKYRTVKGGDNILTVGITHRF